MDKLTSDFSLEFQDSFESNARTYPRSFPIIIKEAQGSIIRDTDGKEYIDFLAGAGVLALGHNHPKIVEAMKDQLSKGIHYLDFLTEIKWKFIQKNLEVLGTELKDKMKIHFCGPTGADGVESAIKLAKIYTGRTGIFSFQGGFHGSTHGTMSLTGLRKPKEKLGTLVPDVTFFPYGYCYRCPLSLKKDQCETNCIKYLENTLNDVNGGVHKPAAVILEMIQGEGGVVEAPSEFVRELVRVCRANDILIIVDEIQTGCGRTGSWFSFSHYDFDPDIIIASKAIGAGLPLCIIYYKRHLDVWDPGAHTGTFRSNNLALAGNLAMLEAFETEKVMENVVRESEFIRSYLDSLKLKSEYIGDIRGIGLMLGVEIIDPETQKSDPKLAKVIQKKAFRDGLIVELGGRDDCVIRFLPPLNITRDISKQALDILARTLE